MAEPPVTLDVPGPPVALYVQPANGLEAALLISELRMSSFVVSLVWARTLPIVVAVACGAAGLAGSVKVVAAETLGADPAVGYDLAARVCSACHLIEPRHAGPVVDGVPTLMAIADTLDDEEIETLLLAPGHPVMPEAPLSRAELGHLVAYIRSLATD